LSVTSLNNRLGKLAGEGQSLEWWATQYARDGAEVPDHILISFAAGRMIPRHLADAFFDHHLCVAWREGPDFRHIHFPDWLEEQGTSIDAVLDEARRARGGQ
jgi:hypothetical protein